MRQAELQHYRAMLQAQAAAAPAKRRLFGQAAPAQPVTSGGWDSEAAPAVRPPPSRGHGLFGRRKSEPEAPAALAEPLLLDLPAPPPAAARLRFGAGETHLAETPFLAEDLAEPVSNSGPAPGVIAGWSAVKPPSAETRLLRRLGAVLEAERQGLGARLEAAGIAA